MQNRMLKELRRNKGMTQLEVANQVGITDVGYLNYEQGKREPKVRTAIRIAKALGTDVETLWSGNSLG